MTRLSAIIPTYGRDRVLVETIEYLMKLQDAPDEIVIVDQTPAHDTESTAALERWHADGRIVWMRRSEPSIPKAMNAGVLAATGDLVLFLDDDIRPDEQLIAAHRRAHRDNPASMIAGRVLQPWHEGRLDPPDSSKFHFNSSDSRDVDEFMGGNACVPRHAMLELGGFDENFVRVAYRFEADFALRWRRSGRRIRYEPEALIHHLKAGSGGTRTFGDYLRTASPAHSVGEYYFLVKSRPRDWLKSMLRRPVRAVATRHHLRRPWWIPFTLIAEVSGFCWALLLSLKGRRLMVEGGSLEPKCQ